ncbi:MAG: IclR family transcriptional regulator [Rhodospirillaceae bacterium]|jgi:DNA-binding IclR family transcriptional regulator
MEGQEKGVTAVDRALTIIESFRDRELSLSLQELAARTGLHKATIIRLIASLERFGYMVKTAPGTYALGSAFLRYGSIYQSSLQLSDHVVPVLRDLVQRTGETSAFYVRDGDMRICLYKVESTAALRSNQREGDRRPLLPGGTGKVLLAFSEDGGPELDDIRSNYFVHNKGERHPEISSIAVPIFATGNLLAGAMSMSGPITHFTAKAVQKFKPALMDAAARLTQQLGGDPSPFLERLENKTAA